MNYTFKCPIEGCSWESEVGADNRDMALDKLSGEASMHVKNVHPDLSRTEEEVRSDVSGLMKEEDSNPQNSA